MFNKHLLKVILGFCGVIILGLVSLVFIDSCKEERATVKAENPVPDASVTKIPPVKKLINSKTAPKAKTR